MKPLRTEGRTLPLRFLRRLSDGRPCERGSRAQPLRLEALETRNLLSGASGAWNFVTAPRLHPVTMSVQTQQPGTAPGLVLVAPYAATQNTRGLAGQNGPLIVDKAGNPVWFLPLSNNHKVQALDFQTQTLNGQPVLTWWQGTIAGPVPSDLPAGAALPGGRFIIENDHYQKIMTVRARNGFNMDEHEFLITPQGDAVFVATKVVKADLTPYGGLKHGAYIDPEVQEINLRTGKLVFAWNMNQHVPLSDILVPAPATKGEVWDAYHINSVDLSPDGSQLLVSARNVWTVYDISHQTGQILWQIGGKENQFQFPSDLVTGPYDSVFQYQHDARFVPGGISVFDDAGEDAPPDSGPYGPGRGMIFNLDVSQHTASLQAPLYYHDPALYPNSQGDVEPLSNGDEFIAWGEDKHSDGNINSYYAEFTHSGTMIYDAAMPSQYVSYRAFSDSWVGLPLTKPAVVVTAPKGGPRTVYASWNGSTETVAWELLAGPTRTALSVVSTTPRDGFETTMATTDAGPFYQVIAMGADGAVLRSSAVVRARGR